MEQKDKKKNIITLTYGDCAENHVGMQQLGKKEDNGFSMSELISLYKKVKGENGLCELIILNDQKHNISWGQ